MTTGRAPSSAQRRPDVPGRRSPPAGDRAALALPAVIGHRGAAGAAPENTLAGIRMAKHLGASWIEFDVKLTSDGYPILFHDDRLERTTDGNGPVAATTLAQIRRLDAGGWFSAGFRGEGVPTFEEALMLCAELGLGINVEIKPCRGREAETAKATTEALLRLWPDDRPAPVISSFAPKCLEVAREIAPELPRGYLAGRLPRPWQQRIAHYDCASLHLDQRWLRVGQRAAVLAAGLPLVLYTVNHPEAARRHLESGVSAVITDDIELVLGAIAAGAACDASAPPAR